ncbi:MAG: NAD(P)H-dependent oxidoreductase [Candidatus Obscuribacterales bacterium]|nr:NAD(P)H-dependent oxidoreductase [Candidatus Obscuribacterales bacterium]
MSSIVVSTSLNPQSKSSLLARETHKILSSKEETDWIDLREFELPQCDGDKAYAHPNVHIVSKKLEKASCIFMAVAIYNYDCGASAKNLVELTGGAWEDKTVAFLCAAGGKSSYMSIMSLANSLMLDFRSVIVPRFVYTDGSAFHNGKISDPDIIGRIEQLVNSALRLESAMEKPI